MFGQTVTASGDTMMQYHNRRHAHPNKWICMDIECDAGCGVVPFRYRDKNFVNALQRAIGLELFLLVDDPWRIFLTTDRSEEHTSELQSLMRISYAVFCWKKKKITEYTSKK